MAYKRTSRRSSTGKAAEINIVPLLDVLLVLLLIFMATAPIISQSVNVDLPEASDSKAVSTDNKPPVIVEVSGIGQYALKVGDETIEQIPEQQVIAEAQAKLKEDPKTIFLIGGAKDVPYDEVIKALNMLHRAGVTSVGLMTQPI